MNIDQHIQETIYVADLDMNMIMVSHIDMYIFGTLTNININ